MSKKEKRITLIRFDPRRIRRFRPLARLVSRLLPWCGPLSLLAGCAAMALERLSLRQLLLELSMAEFLAALALALPGIALHEIGHMIAAIADGCAVDEVGIYVCGWSVTSVYVNMDKHRSDRSGVQQALAGVRAESLYAGVLLFLGAVLLHWQKPPLRSLPAGGSCCTGVQMDGERWCCWRWYAGLLPLRCFFTCCSVCF